MRVHKPTWIIAASCLALVLLILFQVSWLQHSRRLLEEQFDQKVTMALCSAVENLGRERLGDSQRPNSCQKNPDQHRLSNTDRTDLHQAVTAALQRYGIDLDFRIETVADSPLPNTQSAAYCASLEPLTMNNRNVQVVFGNKEKYIIRQLGFMAGASVFILLFVSIMLLVALLSFIRQKRFHEESIDFFNHMAHEFRTPLTNIQLALRLFQKRRPETADSRFLQVIQGENDRLLEQVERLLQVASLERGKYPLQVETIHLPELLAEVVNDMHIQAQERNGRIRLDITNQANIYLKGDRLHLGNMLRNLLDNALKYCDREPDIAVTLGTDDQFACLCIQDNGIGISRRRRSFIFRKFRRWAPADMPQQRGFGLGLAYVKQVVEQHGGTIRVESEPHQGSNFYLWLPLNNPAYV